MKEETMTFEPSRRATALLAVCETASRLEDLGPVGAVVRGHAMRLLGPDAFRETLGERTPGRAAQACAEILRRAALDSLADQVVLGLPAVLGDVPVLALVVESRGQRPGHWLLALHPVPGWLEAGDLWYVEPHGTLAAYWPVLGMSAEDHAG